ncbi:MAG TPA: pitrilysin family protein [Terriglobales bacterium]|nr:pitrilysin family protein [Terriglobales bacterium]
MSSPTAKQSTPATCPVATPIAVTATPEAQHLERTVLDNGLTIVSEQMSHVRSVTMGIWVLNGSRRELAADNGITHFIEHMVFKGTSHRSAEEIARSVDSIGGNLDAFTSKENVCFSAKVLDEHVPIAFEVLADIVLNPLFRAEDIEREQGVILQEIKMDEDNPDYLVHEIFTQNFWKDHPLGRPILGTKETVSLLKQDKLFNYYQTCFSPDNLLIAAAGNIEHARLVDLARHWFENQRAVPNGHRDVAPATHARIVLRNKKQLEQVQICLGLPAPSLMSEERYAWSVLNTVVGGGMSSRLFQNIRERQGLAYSVFSDLNPYRDTGLFGVFAGTSNKTVRQVLQSILNEMRDLRENAVPDEELRRAKDNLKGSLMLGLESTGARMSNLARQQIYFGRFIGMNELLDKVEQVTAEDLQRITAHAFDPAHMALTVLGNLNGLRITRADLAA